MTRKPQVGDKIRSELKEGTVSRVVGVICFFDITKNVGLGGGFGETSFIWSFNEGLNTYFEIIEDSP